MPSDSLEKYSYQQLDLSQHRVLLRTCLNVPTDEEGRMLDPSRFEAALPFIQELALKAKSLVIMAHLGRPPVASPPSGRPKIPLNPPLGLRPEGTGPLKKGDNFRKFSFWHVAECLRGQLQPLGIEVELVSDLEKVPTHISPSFATTFVTTSAVKKATAGRLEGNKKIYLLENIRFFPEEESSDEKVRLGFAKKLAEFGDVFINDAFEDYRPAVSTYDIAKVLPGYLGPIFLKEVANLQKFKNPKKPFIVVLGGAKLSEKLDAMLALLKQADKVLVGGAMSYTLLKAKGIGIGGSKDEDDKLPVAHEMLDRYADKIMLPIDHIVVDRFEEAAAALVQPTQDIPDKKIAIDIGPETTTLFHNQLRAAASILWNGPMGVFEWDSGSRGTKAIGEAIAANKTAFTLAGGGDTLAAMNKLFIQKMGHVSTGGGAMLSYLAHDTFPTLHIITGSL